MRVCTSVFSIGMIRRTRAAQANSVHVSRISISNIVSNDHAGCYHHSMSPEMLSPDFFVPIHVHDKQVIALIAHLRSKNVNGPFLVTAPLATLPNWVNEFRKWLPSAEVLLYHGAKDHRCGTPRLTMKPRRGSINHILVHGDMS